ncbi:MAG: ATP-dependent zinc metalloprotease FtsH, partial [Candidatus Liptonbacteria bacterium]|nr:ATP-dependent zinc metalloprotease FtsH [Candidatus Liptonbacteria bacterium]
LKNPKKFLDIGARIPRGVLLMGSPGTGKTLLARAVAGEAGVPFFHISASEFVEMFVGGGASRTRDAFATAKRAAPSILFIDEIDAVGRERGAGLGGGHDEREQTLNQILVEMDGFDRDTQVIVLAATNRPDVLDSALLRPGRFDRRVYLDLPDISEREQILNIHIRGKKSAENVDMKTVAVRTPGFSGADLANLTNEAAILAAKHGRKQVAQQDLLDSIEKVLLGPERKTRVISPDEKKTIAYHEAGHALVAASLKDADPVHKISIVSRGHAGGYTLKLPTEERRLRTRSRFLADLAVLLGGYVSEKLTFGDITTGASDDLQKAAEISRLLVTRYGMSEKFGPMTFPDGDEMVFLGRELASGKHYSENSAMKIDAEAKSFIDRAHELAQKILKQRKNVLKQIANALLEKEVLEREEFEKIIGAAKLSPLAAV